MQSKEKGLNLKARTFLALCLVLTAAWFWHQWNVRREKSPEEVQAGFNALYEKFAGAGYFHLDPEAANRAPGEDYQIARSTAQLQIDRVTRERGLNTNSRLELEKLIDQLSEPSESRVMGESTVNGLRLNLALDRQFNRKDL